MTLTIVAQGTNFQVGFDIATYKFYALSSDGSTLYDLELSDDVFVASLGVAAMFSQALLSIRDNYLATLPTISSDIAALSSSLENLSVDADVQPVIDYIDSFKDEFLASVSSEVGQAILNFTGFSLLSLNGSYGTYKDGSTVAVKGLTEKYKVEASFLMLNDQNQYITVYKLSELSNPERILYVPNVFVTFVAE